MKKQRVRSSFAADFIGFCPPLQNLPLYGIINLKEKSQFGCVTAILYHQQYTSKLGERKCRRIDISAICKYDYPFSTQTKNVVNKRIIERPISFPRRRRWKDNRQLYSIHDITSFILVCQRDSHKRKCRRTDTSAICKRSNMR